MSVNQMQFIVDAAVRGGELPTPGDTFRVGDLSVHPGDHRGMTTVFQIARQLGVPLPKWERGNNGIIFPDPVRETDTIKKAVADIWENTSLTAVPGTKAPTDTWLACMRVIEENMGASRRNLSALPPIQVTTMSYPAFVHEHPQQSTATDYDNYLREEVAKETLACHDALDVWTDFYSALNTLLNTNGFELDGRVCLTRQETHLHTMLVHLQAGQTSEAVDVIAQNHFLLDFFELVRIMRPYVAGYMNPERVAALGQRAREQLAQQHKPTLQSIGASTEILDVRNPIRRGFNAKLETFLGELVK